MTNLLNGRYRPENTITHGGTGTVLKCTDINLHRTVAVKFLQPYREKRRIFDEIAALQHIRSKNVVEIYDIVIQPPDNRIGIVQEYLEGDSLDTLAPFKGPPNEFIKLIFQMANGLADIHHQNLIHRDIKPNNMRLDSEGLVNIFDFDLSRPEGPQAQTSGFKGTHGFAAPEIYAFGPVSFNKSIDIYALGATVLYLAMGILPPELLSHPPASDLWLSSGGFETITIDLPDAIIKILNRTLSKIPSQRPSAAEIKDVFATYLLQNKHRALLVHGKTYVCDTNARSFKIKIPERGTMRLTYDGLAFHAWLEEGYVSINNIPLSSRGESTLILGSCVLAFGAPTLNASERIFIPLDVSHPEVVL